MKFLRRKLVSRPLVTLLLVVFVQPLVTPYYAFALTTGPHQQEFISYESPGATDMVNLLTGDFSTSIPLLDVPGPEGNFSVPLSYNAGIGLEQEASWTGLGWNINVGAVTRIVNGFPDDASGESQSVTVQDLTGVRGWSSALMGLGQAGWNNHTGHYGVVNLSGIVSYQWNQKGETYGVFGMKGGAEPGFDAVSFAMAVATVVSWGAASGAAQAGTAAASKGMSVGAQIALNFAVGAVISAFNGAATPSSTRGYWETTKVKDQRFLYKNYWIWLDKTRREDMYGTLYLHRAPLVPHVPWHSAVNQYAKINGNSQAIQQFAKIGGVNRGAASDISHYVRNSYATNEQPATLAPDQYSVRAPGIAGIITPYRLETGSVSMPREMTNDHTRLSPVSYFNYKVPFVYKGTNANAYYHHSVGVADATAPGFMPGVAFEVGNTNPNSNTSLTYNLQDMTLSTSRIKAEVAGTKRIPQHSFVEWMSNEEIRNSVTYPSGFMDFLSAEGGATAPRTQFRSNLMVGSSALISNVFTSSDNVSLTIPVNTDAINDLEPGKPIELFIDYYENLAAREAGTLLDHWSYSVFVQSRDLINKTITVTEDSPMGEYFGKYAEIEIRYRATPQIQASIGAYSITAADGLTYHFALPVYDYDLQTEVRDVVDPQNKKSLISRATPFANTWLLTAVTGSDFVDRNNNGMVDDADWGYWVKFNYGKHLDDYWWRIPYQGYRRSLDGKSETMTKGSKQVYYLNTIETRSHVALFMKSDREDGRSARGETMLKLDEICLLPKAHYKRLVAPGHQNGFNIDDYSAGISKTCRTFSPQSTARAYVEQNCLKRIVFNYNYELCTNTPNSTALASGSIPAKGKLTLKSVTQKGKNDQRLVPDYNFEYGAVINGVNPQYNSNNWDGWGYFGTAEGHKTPQDAYGNLCGASWSLQKIRTPLGGEVSIEYERDTYASIAGRTIYGDGYGSISDFDYWSSTMRVLQTVQWGSIANGDKVKIEGFVQYRCENDIEDRSARVDGIYTVDEVDADNISVQEELFPLQTTCSVPPLDITSVSLQIKKIIESKKGGDIRVASLTMKNEWGEEKKIKYGYNLEDGRTSSGVVTQEPEFIKQYDVPEAEYPGYPETPVMYGRVSISSGKFADEYDYHTRQIYEFETFHYNMLQVSNVPVDVRRLISTKSLSGGTSAIMVDEYIKFNHFRVTDRSSKVGSLKRVTTEGAWGSPVSETTMEYTDVLSNDVDPHQGVYTEGTLMADQLQVPDGRPHSVYNNISRTSVIHYPYALKKITYTKDGFTAETGHLKWDFITGGPLESLHKNKVGLYTKSVVKPAYTIDEYAQMRSKAVDLSNKNMLAQSAASYLFRSNAAAESIGLVSAEVQTWKKTWPDYKLYSTEFPEGQSVILPETWRVSDAYAWKGTYAQRNSDGTRNFQPNVDDYEYYAGAQNLGWQRLVSPLLYDPYSMPLEHINMNNIYSAVRMGYDHRLKIAEAGNARYNEIAFTSAEDLVPGTTYFGSEVNLGNGTILYKRKGNFVASGTGDAALTSPHTGDAAVAVNANRTFIFKPVSLTPNQKYKVSVWCSNENGRLYYKLNGGPEVTSGVPTQQYKAGKWYRLTFEVPLGVTFTSLEVGAKALTGIVVFDDFRFQPSNATMACYVYPPLDYEYTTDFSTSTFVLDNDNMYTRFEESADGRLTRTYIETIQYSNAGSGEKLVTETKRDYRKFYKAQ